MQSYEHAYAHVAALTGSDPNTAIVDFRAIHDIDKTVPGIPRRGTLPELWNELCGWNAQGYGVFINVNAMDGNGRELSNVAYCRAHVVDLDNISAEVNLQRASQHAPLPSFAVNTSPGKYHVYWPCVPYVGNDRFTLTQRKLKQLFDGDKSVIDPTRVTRLAGTYHCKATPFLTTFAPLGGLSYAPITPEALEASLAAVNVIDGGGGRHELGDPELAAPSLEWIKSALSLIDPNRLDRYEWVAVMSAIKQAGWNVCGNDPETLYEVFAEWCARYDANDIGENRKNWDSIRNTEIGWKYIVRKAPGVNAHLMFGGRKHEVPPQLTPTIPATPPNGHDIAVPPPKHDVMPMPPPAPPALDGTGELLTHIEQKQFFAGCIYVTTHSAILTPSSRYLGPTGFNAEYGGKKFIIDEQAKVTDEAWKAATRSTLWTVPKVDHIRFLPHLKHAEIVEDELGRKGVNVYRPARIKTREGDPTPFLNQIAYMFPVQSDVDILMAYFAHNAKFPGYKIPWSPVIQSAEGAGKGTFKRMVTHMMGGIYVHFPNARQMTESGAKFNGWMRHKLFILADEIKVDERRDMIEVLKPMISETEIEVESKGVDQLKEDNYANWAFFSNFKDAIPVNENARRFAQFFSAIQSKKDLLDRGMTDAYFNWFYDWLDNQGGIEIVTNYLMQHPIERGGIPMRAPITSSTAEAIKAARGPVEQMIMDAVADGAPGFRFGWVSVQAVIGRYKMKAGKSLNDRTVTAILDSLQYYEIGKSVRPFMQENAMERSLLYNFDRSAQVENYGPCQGYG